MEAINRAKKLSQSSENPAKNAKPERFSTAKNPGQRKRIKPVYNIPEVTAPPKRILAAAVVERLPIITPDPTPWESAMWDLQERKRWALRKPIPDDWFRDDSGGLRKAEEEEGAVQEDPSLSWAPRITEADTTNDTKSLDRALQKRLFLVVKRKGEKLDGESDWTFPQSDRKEGESMREAAVRTIESFVGNQAQMYFVGYCPMGYLDRGEGEARARIFFYKCQFISGTCNYEAGRVDDYKWLTNEELINHLDPPFAKLSRDICEA